MNRGKLAPSIMCADLKHLEEDIHALEAAGCDYLHFDIMDGVFVPNYALGPDTMRHVREITDTPFDIHLMIVHPEQHLHLFDIRPGDYVSIHAEACAHPERILRVIREQFGAKPMLALNPGTPLSALEYIMDALDAVLVMTVNPGFAGQRMLQGMPRKIRELKELLCAYGREDIEIEVDGNVNVENARLMRTCGADLFVAGSSGIFTPGRTIREAAALLREVII